MSQNAENALRAIGAFNSGDLESAFQWAHPDIEWVVAREHPDAATHRGREAITAYFREWQRTPDHMRLDMERVLETGDTVVTIGKVCGVGAGSGAQVEIPIAFVSRIEEGRTVRVEEFLNPADALDAAGLKG